MDIDETRRIKLLELINEQFNGNKAAFSRHIGKAPTYVGRWTREPSEHDTEDSKLTNKRRLSAKEARKIEKKCHKPFGWLDEITKYRSDYNQQSNTPPQGRTEDMRCKDEKLQTRQIPLLSWVLARNWAEVMDKFRGNELMLDTIKTDEKLSADGYAVIADNNTPISLPGGKIISPGSTIYIDPRAKLTNGCIVVVHAYGADEASLMKYELAGNRRFLAPLNAACPPIELDGTHVICGRVISFKTTV